MGDQQWEVSDPTKLSELPLKGDSVQVNITMSVGNVWNNTIDIPVISPFGKSVVVSSLYTVIKDCANFAGIISSTANRPAKL